MAQRQLAGTPSSVLVASFTFAWRSALFADTNSPFSVPSFLENYRTFTAGNEAHPNHHLWCALVALSSVISRRVYVEMGYFRVYANLYVVLVAPPGGRKTTAMSTCKNLLRELKDVPFSAESITKEALVEVLKTTERTFTPKVVDGQPIVPQIYCPMTVCVTELSEFIGASKENMIGFLTTIYDQDFYDRRTKKHGEERIVGPYLVLLGCTTPSWITARLRDDVISGGFSRRALFIYESERGSRIPFPEITPGMERAWDDALAYARSLKSVSGIFTWTDSAHSWFDHWYRTYEISKDPNLTGYYESKHMQLLKVAMLLALSESPQLVLDRSHLEFALEILELAERNLAKVFEGMGRNELNAVAAQGMDILRANGGSLTLKKFKSILFASCKGFEIDEVIKHLIDSEQALEVQGKLPSGTPVQIICTPEALKKFQQEVVQIRS